MSDQDSDRQVRPQPACQWLPFPDARAWAHAQGLRSRDQWAQLSKQQQLPDNIPGAPRHVYRDAWKSWGDFLGTSPGHIAKSKPNHHYRPYAQAKSWARAQRIKSGREWSELFKKGKLPADLPATPQVVYGKAFTSWGDFLGTGYIATFYRTYRPFNEARTWARAQGIQSDKQWREISKRPGWLPADIPVTPWQVYKTEWISLGDFFGTGYVSTQNRRYRSFAEARVWAQAQGVQSWTQWNKLSKQVGWLPKDIPADPRAQYGAEFTSFGDFLGTGNRASSDYHWRPFEGARDWARQQQLDDLKAWRALVKLLKQAKRWPEDIPTNASLVYASDWKGWEDFLGVPRMTKRSKVEERLKHEIASCLPIDHNAKRIPVHGRPARMVDICASALHLIIEFDGAFWHRGREAYDHAKTRLLEEAGWTVVRVREHPLGPIGRGDIQVASGQTTFDRALAVLKHLSSLGFVAHEAVAQYEAGGRAVNALAAGAAIRHKWRTFPEARAWAQAQKLKSRAQWDKLSQQEGRRPSDIPAYPWEVYEDEWITLGDFLGTGRLATFNRKYRSFEQARAWAKTSGVKSLTQWRKCAKQSGWLPVDIPATPNNVYGKEWTSWGDFLGTGNRASSDYQWRPFGDARVWAQRQRLKSREEWLALFRRKGVPKYFPASPRTVYADEWRGWGDFLGTGFIAFQYRRYRSFAEARIWARAQCLRSSMEWSKLAKQDGWLPPDIPRNPPFVYKHEWLYWGDFLGTAARPKSHAARKAQAR